MEDQIKEQLSHIKNDLNAQIEKANAQSETAGKVASETKSAIDNLSKEFMEKAGANQELLDSLQSDLKKMKSGLQGGFSNVKSFAEKLAEDSSFKAFAARQSRNTNPIELKAAGTMTESASLTNGTNVSFIEPTRRAGIIPVKREQLHVRSAFGTIPMTGSIYAYAQETAVDGAPTTVAEGATKPASDNDFEMKEAPARKIAHHKRISEELLNDVPALAGFLNTVGVQELMDVEDTQLLTGNGSSSNLTGLNQNALTDANFSGTIFEDRYSAGTATYFDAIIAAHGLIAAGKHNADVIMMNPSDFYFMQGEKDSQGEYLYKMLTYEGNIPLFNGIPVVTTTAVTAGTLVMGDSSAAQIAQREGISVRLYDQDQDNAVKNLVTVVVEERLAFPIYYPTAFYYDTFANTIAAIESAS